MTVDEIKWQDTRVEAGRNLFRTGVQLSPPPPFWAGGYEDARKPIVNMVSQGFNLEKSLEKMIGMLASA